MPSPIIKHVPKGWGYEKWIVNKQEYCGKLLFFHSGKRCSWHYHKIKDEVFYVQSGRLMVYHSEGNDIAQAKQTVLKQGENFHIYPGLKAPNGGLRRYRIIRIFNPTF